MLNYQFPSPIPCTREGRGGERERGVFLFFGGRLYAFNSKTPLYNMFCFNKKNLQLPVILVEKDYAFRENNRDINNFDFIKLPKPSCKNDIHLMKKPLKHITMK